MSMRILSGLRITIKERGALAVLRLSIFILFSLQSSCVVFGVVHYRHEWENGYSVRREVVDENSLQIPTQICRPIRLKASTETTESCH